MRLGNIDGLFFRNHCVAGVVGLIIIVDPDAAFAGESAHAGYQQGEDADEGEEMLRFHAFCSCGIYFHTCLLSVAYINNLTQRMKYSTRYEL